jgi:RNA polymerase sigma-70 factor (ECF subfamily)
MSVAIPLDWHTDSGFESLFKSLYAALYRYANNLLKDEMQADEVVQETFLKLWEQRSALKIETNIQAYLYRTVHNRIMNIFSHEQVREKYKQAVEHAPRATEHSPIHHLQASELEKKIELALQKVPEKCSIVFNLSRQEELSYREIASRLNLSLKTVENQISKALKILRTELSEYLPTVAALILLLNL